VHTKWLADIARRISGQVSNETFGSNVDAVRIEKHEVGYAADLDATPVGDCEELGRLARDAVNGLLERENATLPDVFREEVASVSSAAKLGEVGTGVRGADEHLRMPDDLVGDLLGAVHRRADPEFGVELVLECNLDQCLDS